MTVLVLFGIAISSFLLTWGAIHYAKSKNLLDIPNERSSHDVETPRGGGISFVLISLVGLALFTIFLGFEGGWAWLLFSSLIVVTISYIDDHGHVSSKNRFIAHLIACCSVVYFFCPFPVVPLLGLNLQFGVLGLFMGMILLTWLLNLYNFMDGIDGIASIEALFISISLLILVGIPVAQVGEFRELTIQQEGYAILCLLIIFSVVGFTFWNWPTARIFMGDIGSGFLGFFLGALGLYAAGKEWITIWTVLIIFGVFLVDATITLLLRMYRGESWLQPHRTHFYQRITDKIILFRKRRLENKEMKPSQSELRKYAHQLVNVGVIFINICWLLPAAMLSVYYPQWGVVIMFTAFLPMILIVAKDRISREKM